MQNPPIILLEYLFIYNIQTYNNRTLTQIHQNLKTMEQQLDGSKFDLKFDPVRPDKELPLFLVIHDKCIGFMFAKPSSAYHRFR